jgi:hypothetical protein
MALGLSLHAKIRNDLKLFLDLESAVMEMIGAKAPAM